MEDKHKQERKELQAKIQQIKRSVPKGDKKRQKEANEQIALMVAELDEQQEQETREADSEVTKCEDQLSALELNGDEQLSAEVSLHTTKKSKAAKRREKKELEEKERRARISQQEVENLQGKRHIEQELLGQKLGALKLKLFDVPSDGNCMYNALSHQLQLKNGMISAQQLRKWAADEMRANTDEYLPYIDTPDGTLMDLEGFDAYCSKIEETTEWGGHLELKALSAVLKREIHIIQANQADILIAHCQPAGDPLRIVYHHYLYELGEHYNSVMAADDTR